MSENKRLLARYDAAIQDYAKLLAKAIETGDTRESGYDLIAASVTVDQRRDMVLPYAEGWMLEYIAVATNLIRALVCLTQGTVDASASDNAAKGVAAYESLRSKYFTPEDLASA